MKISSVTICGMHKIKEHTYDFSNANYLYGPNGVGKSTVMQAIQLALLGYIPGTDKTTSAIFRHANGDKMSVTVQFDDGTKIQRTWTKSGKSIKVETVPENLDASSFLSDTSLPILDFNEFINMSSNKLKDWFIDFLPESAASVNWKSELSMAAPRELQLYPEILTKESGLIENLGLNDLEAARERNKFYKEKISALKADFARVQSTVQSLIYYDNCDDSLNKVDILSKIGELEDARRTIDRNLVAVDKNNIIKEKLSHLKVNEFSPAFEESAEYLSLKEEYKAISDEISAIQTKIDNSHKECNLLLAEVDSKNNIIAKGGECPYTNTVCDSIASMISKLTAEVETAKVKIADDEKVCREARTRLEELNSRMTEIKRSVSILKSDYSAYDTLKAQIDSSVEGMDHTNLSAEDEKLKAELQNLRETLVQIEANDRYRALADELHKEKLKIESSIEIYKAWEKLTGVNGIQSKLMVAPFIDFSEEITKNLRTMFDDPTIVAMFNVGEKANSFSFGMMRGSSYLDYDLLSSGEKCLYTLSLLIAINKASKSNCKLLLIDDLLDHLDDDKIKSAFITLYNDNSIQAILAGVKPCNSLELENFVITIGE